MQGLQTASNLLIWWKRGKEESGVFFFVSQIKNLIMFLNDIIIQYGGKRQWIGTKIINHTSKNQVISFCLGQQKTKLADMLAQLNIYFTLLLSFLRPAQYTEQTFNCNTLRITLRCK